MLSTIVNANQSTAQVFSLVALVIAIIGVVIAAMQKAVIEALLFAGIVFVAFGLMFHA